MTIISDLHPNYDSMGCVRISWTYLHGKLESDAGYDCYGVLNCVFPVREDIPQLVDRTKMETGIYPCQYQDKPCTLYFWKCTYLDPHGLVVYDDDVDAVAYAKKKYDEKSTFI